jgi:hypothetical protein
MRSSTLSCACAPETGEFIQTTGHILQLAIIIALSVRKQDKKPSWSRGTGSGRGRRVQHASGDREEPAKEAVISIAGPLSHTTARTVERLSRAVWSTGQAEKQGNASWPALARVARADRRRCAERCFVPANSVPNDDGVDRPWGRDEPGIEWQLVGAVNGDALGGEPKLLWGLLRRPALGIVDPSSEEGRIENFRHHGQDRHGEDKVEYPQPCRRVHEGASGELAMARLSATERSSTMSTGDGTTPVQADVTSDSEGAWCYRPCVSRRASRRWLQGVPSPASEATSVVLQAR